MNCSLNLATVHTFKCQQLLGSFGFQLISATNDSYSGFLPLIMLKNRFIVSMGFKRTFFQRFLVALKPLCTPLSLKPHGTHSREALSVDVCLLSSVAADPCTEVTTWHRNPILSKNSPAWCLFFFFKRKYCEGKILDEIIISIIIFMTAIISLWTLIPMCFPEITPLTNHPNKNKPTQSSGWAPTSALLI